MNENDYRFYDQAGKVSGIPRTYLPEKGLDQAIRIARRAGMKLKVAAKVDRADRLYFETEIKHLLNDPLVEFIGEIGFPETNAFLGNAAALLSQFSGQNRSVWL